MYGRKRSDPAGFCLIPAELTGKLREPGSSIPTGNRRNVPSFSCHIQQEPERKTSEKPLISRQFRKNRKTEKPKNTETRPFLNGYYSWIQTGSMRSKLDKDEQYFDLFLKRLPHWYPNRLIERLRSIPKTR